jgi:hypothetical protein
MVIDVELELAVFIFRIQEAFELEYAVRRLRKQLTNLHSPDGGGRKLLRNIGN